MVPKGGSALEPFITFDGLTVRINPDKPDYVGVYQYSLIGKLPMQALSVPVNLTISNDCDTATLIPSVIEDQKFSVGQGTLSIKVPPWTSSHADCGEIIYKAMAGLGRLPSFLTFDG